MAPVGISALFRKRQLQNAMRLRALMERTLGDAAQYLRLA